MRISLIFVFFIGLFYSAHMHSMKQVVRTGRPITMGEPFKPTSKPITRPQPVKPPLTVKPITTIPTKPVGRDDFERISYEVPSYQAITGIRTLPPTEGVTIPEAVPSEWTQKTKAWEEAKAKKEKEDGEKAKTKEEVQKEAVMPKPPQRTWAEWAKSQAIPLLGLVISSAMFGLRLRDVVSEREKQDKEEEKKDREALRELQVVIGTIPADASDNEIDLLAKKVVDWLLREPAAKLTEEFVEKFVEHSRGVEIIEKAINKITLASSKQLALGRIAHAAGNKITEFIKSDNSRKLITFIAQQPDIKIKELLVERIAAQFPALAADEKATGTKYGDRISEVIGAQNEPLLVKALIELVDKKNQLVIAALNETSLSRFKAAVEQKVAVKPTISWADRLRKFFGVKLPQAQ